MRPDHRPTPAQIIGELLRNHPEAASLLARATHWRMLAVWSAATVRRKLAAALAARLAYEELGRLLEPRRRHPINLVVGLLLLLVLSAGLVMLNLIELGGLRSVPAALAATAVWLTEAWLGAVAARHRRWTLVAAVTGAAFLLGLLLVALHTVDPHPAWPDAVRRAVLGALTGVSHPRAHRRCRRAHGPSGAGQAAGSPATLVPGPGRLRGGGRDRAGRCPGRRGRQGILARSGPGPGNHHRSGR